MLLGTLGCWETKYCPCITSNCWIKFAQKACDILILFKYLHPFCFGISHHRLTVFFESFFFPLLKEYLPLSVLCKLGHCPFTFDQEASSLVSDFCVRLLAWNLTLSQHATCGAALWLLFAFVVPVLSISDVIFVTRSKLTYHQ